MSMKKMTSYEKKKFEEGRALKVLQLIFPEKYRGAVLSDAPDIKNAKLGIGVEVTSSIKQEVQEGTAKVRELNGKGVNELTQRNFEQIKSKGVHVYISPLQKVVSVFTYWGNTHDPIQAYYTKIEKLNAPHYTTYPENNLFITSWMIDHDELESCLEYFKKGQNLTRERQNSEGQTIFDRVYILTEGLLIEINIEKGSICRHLIKREQMDNINQSAFKDVFGVSRAEYYG